MPIDPSEAHDAVRQAIEDAEKRLDEKRGARGKLVRPCATAFEDVIVSLTDTDERVRLGLAPIDVLTRGFGPKELILLCGFAHAGKTQLGLTAIHHNLRRRVLFFSMDDPAEMVLLKLACMSSGDSAEDIERRLRAGDLPLEGVLRSFAVEQLRDLLVVDASLSMRGIDEGLVEATTFWGAPPELVIIDYLGSIQTGADLDSGEGIKAKAAALKAWVKDKPFPTLVLHQNTRGRGAPGEHITMMSGAYGGEQEATMVLGVRRQRDWSVLSAAERRRHKHTVTVHLVKNKRPPARITPPRGIDFYMEPLTGLIRPIRDDDVLDPSAPVRTAEQAVRHGGLLAA